MPTGTGLNRFQAPFPRCGSSMSGIAEQHAVTLATGMAMGGLRPFVAIYSTFLQRAFDQMVHDVCQNDQPVVIGVDRAGLVGEDGTSHQGMFTIPPGARCRAPRGRPPEGRAGARLLLRTAFSQDHPFALHYPRDPGLRPAVRSHPKPIPIGQGELLHEGTDLLLVGFGPIVQRARHAAKLLAADGWSAPA